MAPLTVNLNVALLAPRKTAEQIRDEEKVSSAVSLHRRGLASFEAAASFADVPKAWLLSRMPDDEAPQLSDEKLGRDAQRYIAVDPGVLSGTPCVKGTRVPAYYIADMAANGDTVPDILAAYPYVTEAQVYAAIAYTRAFSRLARQDHEPRWRTQEPVTLGEIPLDELPPAL